MWHHFNHVIFEIFIPSMLFITVAAGVVIFFTQVISKPSLSGWKSLVVSFTLLGGVIGIFVGMSKAPVIGTVLPALLTFITGLLAYLFGKESLKG